MFDHNNRVTHIAQLFQTADKTLVIALVQADRRLIQYIQHIHQPAAYLRGQSDTLTLAAGQALTATTQTQITQSDCLHEP